MIPDRTYRALLIANSQFPEDPHELQQLVGPPHDVEVLRVALTAPSIGMFHRDDVQQIVEASRTEIEKALENCANTAGENDTLFVYYSGHGVVDAHGRFYIASRDTSTHLLASTSISADTINAILTKGYARNVILVLDCCHSGAYAFKGSTIPETLRGGGYHLLASSTR